jgi:hypothetical protein
MGQAAGLAAGAVLKRLDRAAQTLVLVGCLDEIFFRRRPVLVGVELHSMVWFLGTKAEDRKGSIWSAALQPWTALRYVVSDAGTGLQAGLDRMQEHRRQTERVLREKGLDVLKTRQEALRVLKILGSRVERTWEQAEPSSRRNARVATRGAARPSGPVRPGRRQRWPSSGMRKGRRLGTAPSPHLEAILYTDKSALSAGRLRRNDVLSRAISINKPLLWLSI